MEKLAESVRGQSAWELLNSASTAIILATADGRIYLANTEAEALFGYEIDELVGECVEILLPEDLREVHTHHRGNYHRDPSLRPMGVGLDLVGRKKNGTEFPLEVGLSFVKIGDQTLTMSFIIDISARKEKENERIEHEVEHQKEARIESLGTLAGGVAHDFNNLLMCIHGNVELAMLELPKGSRAREYLSEIDVAAWRSAEIVGQMLTYSGKGGIKIREINLPELIGSWSAVYQQEVGGNIDLVLDLSENLPPIAGDSGQLRLTFTNLIKNATEAIGGGKGVITVSTDLVNVDRTYLQQTYIGRDLQEGAAVILEVADTGGGMDASVSRKVFEPFFSTKFEGRGLGMAAVLGVVRGHGAAINVYSEPNRGTTVKIIFPIAGLHDAQSRDRERNERNERIAPGKARCIGKHETVT